MAVLEFTGSKATAEPTAEMAAAAHAPAPWAICVATSGNGICFDDSTSQCHGDSDDRDSMQRRSRHEGFLHFRCNSGTKRIYRL
jgi:hypothetical protein